jgi:hypothetical protein
MTLLRLGLPWDKVLIFYLAIVVCPESELSCTASSTQGISSTIESVEIKSIQKKKLQMYPFRIMQKTIISMRKMKKQARANE